VNTIPHLEWRNLNASRNYPFLDSSTLSFSSGFLPQSWIVDARIYARGNYASEQPCYVSRVTRTDAMVALQLSSAAGDVLGEAKIEFGSTKEQISIFDSEGVLGGCLVIDPSKSFLLQSVDEGQYELTPEAATFLPAVCEYLPKNQVQSLNEKSGDITLTGNEGIRVDRLDSNTIKISVLGDPHFTRYECVDPNYPQSEVLNLNGIFLKNITLVHYVKTLEGSLVGPFATKLKQKADGSVVLSLKTAAFNPTQDTRELRPAFRITTEGNSIIFSMAGG